MRSYLSLTSEKQRFVLPEPGMLEVQLLCCVMAFLIRPCQVRISIGRHDRLSGREVQGKEALEDAKCHWAHFEYRYDDNR